MTTPKAPLLFSLLLASCASPVETGETTATERFFIPASSPALTLAPPAGAVGWRVLGRPSDGHADSPFAPGVNYHVLPYLDGTPLDAYDGPYLEGIRTVVIPLPAAADGILVSTPSTDVQGAIEWTIERAE